MSDTPRQVVALVDGHECSLASVRRAAPLAVRHGVPLVVAFVAPTPSALAVMSVPAVLLGDEALEAEVFDGVAAEVAPSGVAWDFRTVPSHADLATAWHPVERRHTLLVAVSHRRGHRWWFAAPRGRVKQAMARLRNSPLPPVIVGCGAGTDPAHAAALAQPENLRYRPERT